MALKKSQLYSSLWQSCDELRGGMDASQYKDYILTLLFMKYVSDKFAGKPDAIIEVPKGGSFADMVKLKGDKEIGDKINKIIGKLAEANDLKGVIDEADFNDESKLGSGKEMQDRLSKLVAIFDGLDFQANRAEGDDLLGDAYEYLMRHFATESGKSKGQFYTPAEVSRILAKVVGIGPKTKQDETIYDPTCGSGSLLLKAADESPQGITIYGQENDVATWALARMNMILHGHPTADLWRGNTLSAPYFKNDKGKLRTFDFAVANPPFSLKAWTSGFSPDNDEFGRFEYGVPPTKNGDYAFLLHVIGSLKSKGKAAVILPHGVLFRGNKEADIRKNLITRGLIKGIIGLPANLFYGTGIPACIIVIDKENAHARTGIFMVDASKGFQKDGNKNRLRSQDIHKIVDVFKNQIEQPRFSRMVPVSEIADPSNDYNLNIPRYIDSSEPEDLHDLEAHLRGGIPNRDIEDLAEYWNVFPSLRQVLFQPGDRDGYSEACVEAQQVKPTILAHDEFVAYQQRVSAIFDQWRAAHTKRLHSLKVNDLPRQVVHELSEDLLTRFADLPLLSRYDVYQRLMDYWAEVMQDDVYLIAGDGWLEAAKPRGVIDDKEKKIKETPDLVVKKKKYKMDLIPPPLIVARYFAEKQAEIDALQAKQDEATQALEEYTEEHAVEEGLLEEALNDKGKVTKGGVSDRLKALKDEPDSDEEEAALKRCLELMDAEADAKKAVKAAQEKLDAAVLKKYDKLSEREIKVLVADDKWTASIRSTIEDVVNRAIGSLAERVKMLWERYAFTLSQIEARLTKRSERVRHHLEQMGESSSGDLVHCYTRLPGFSDEWREKQLYDLVGGRKELFDDGDWIESEYITTSGIRLIQTGNIGIGRFLDKDTRRYITEESFQKLRCKEVKVGDLLICRLADPAGRACIMPDIGENKMVTAVDVTICRPLESEAVPEFLVQLFSTRWWFEQVDVRCGGTTRSRIARGQLSRITLSLPSVEEQREIAQVLADIDAEMLATEDWRHKVDAVKHSMMQFFLTGPSRVRVEEAVL